jgi:hypothetical protein
MFLKRDPGRCPIDDAPHTTCVAPNTSGVIVAGPITPATSVTVPTPSTPSTPPVVTTATPPTPPPDLPTSSPRRRRGA